VKKLKDEKEEASGSSTECYVTDDSEKNNVRN
jgi:hypothetical protein